MASFLKKIYNFHFLSVGFFYFSDFRVGRGRAPTQYRQRRGEALILVETSNYMLRYIFVALTDVKMTAKQRKIAIMGSRSVGKSSLALQFVQVITYFLPKIEDLFRGRL